MCGGCGYMGVGVFVHVCAYVYANGRLPYPRVVQLRVPS